MGSVGGENSRFPQEGNRVSEETESSISHNFADFGRGKWPMPFDPGRQLKTGGQSRSNVVNLIYVQRPANFDQRILRVNVGGLAPSGSAENDHLVITAPPLLEEFPDI